MSLELFLSFALTTLILDLAPGPAVTLVVSMTMGKSLKSGLLASIGLQIGNIVWFSASVAAMLLSYHLSNTLMFVLTYGGSFYLIYLGLKSFIKLPDIFWFLNRTHKINPSLYASSLSAGFMTTISNPKSYIYWLAFLPQFQPSTGPTLIHNLILLATALPITLSTQVCYALIARRAQQTLVGDVWKQRFDYLSGAVMIGVGLWMILTH